MIDIAAKQIIPAVVKYTKTLADTVIAVKEAGADASVQEEMLSEVTALLAEAKKALSALSDITEEAAESVNTATKNEHSSGYRTEFILDFDEKHRKSFKEDRFRKSIECSTGNGSTS